MLVDPREASEIAKHTGTTVAMVHRVIASYNRLGVSAVETAGKGGRRRQSMSLAEEQALLAPFFSRAERGEIATVGEIQRAFEAQMGHQVHIQAGKLPLDFSSAQQYVVPSPALALDTLLAIMICFVR